jgi:hypothetical protein
VLFVFGATASSGSGLAHSRGFLITLNDTPQSVGLLRTSVQPDAETSTWQHTQHCTTDKHPCHRRDSNPQPGWSGLAHSRGFLNTLNVTPQSVGLLRTSVQPDAETSTWQHHTALCNRQTSLPLAGFEPTSSVGELPQTFALDRAVTGIGETIFKQQ